MRGLKTSGSRQANPGPRRGVVVAPLPDHTVGLASGIWDGHGWPSGGVTGGERRGGARLDRVVPLEAVGEVEEVVHELPVRPVRHPVQQPPHLPLHRLGGREGGDKKGGAAGGGSVLLFDAERRVFRRGRATPQAR